MKMKLLVAILTGLTLFVSACSDDAAETTGEQSAEEKITEKDELSNEDLVKKVLEDNLNFAEEEDIEGYMNTLSAEIRNTEGSTEEMQAVFDNYDIDYEMMDVNLKSISEEEAIVELKQKSIASFVAEGLQYQNNTATVTHTLVMEDGEYKFSSTDIGDIVYLDANGEPIEGVTE